MENYRIPFVESEREAIIKLLSEYNDIIINNLDDRSIGITIQHDNAEHIYRALLDQINREIRTEPIVTIQYRGDSLL